jgi:excisionase family DNA binding protein
MNLSDQNKGRLTLLTSQEVASILKMNPQVVARKLSSGELEGYKLGKEWRVSEDQLLQYLEKHKNTPSKNDKAAKTMRAFFKNGKLTAIPMQRSKRRHVLKFLVEQLSETEVYTEKEINDFIKQYHSDVCTIRREFIMNKLMVRKDGKYKRVSWQD